MKKILLILGLISCAIYPIVFLYSYNVQELILQQLINPVFLSLLITMVIFFICYLVFKDFQKALLVTLIFLVLFWNYGLIVRLLNKFFYLKHRHILPLVLFIYGNIIYLMFNFKKEKFVINVNKIICLSFVVLVLFNFVQIIPYEIKKYSISKEDLTKDTTKLVDLDAKYPDIYYIILDEYASLNTIKEIWGYDNSEFISFLKEEGFYIINDSKSRYHSTLWVMPSILNLEYVTEKVSNQDFYEYLRWNKKISQYNELSAITYIDLIDKFNNNKLMKLLKDKGYTTVVNESLSLGIPSINLQNIDYYYKYDNSRLKSSLLDDFGNMLLDRCMLKPLSFLVNFEASNGHYNLILYSYSKAKEIINLEGPKFSYIHISSPHTPFIFDQEGKYVPNNESNWKNKKYYLDQYIYVTKEIESIVNDILQKSKREPIIIIQSDHGPRPINNNNPEQSLDIPVEHMFKIFNAVYLPDGQYQDFYENIGAINTLRIVLNLYTGENFDLIEDE